MSRPHAIDSEDTLFDFDSFESTTLATLEFQLPTHSTTPDMRRSLHQQTSIESTLAECAAAHPSRRLCDLEDIASDPNGQGKGKGRSVPVNIQPRDTVSQFDMFSLFSGDVGNFDLGLSSYPTLSSSSSTPQTIASFAFSPSATPDSVYRAGTITPGSSYGFTYDEPSTCAEKGKGKARDSAPCLPPLSFSPTEFTRGETNWPIQASPSPQPEDSSPRFSLAGSRADYDSSPSTQNSTLHSRVPSRARSLSSLSAHSTKSLAARSMSRIKVRFGKTTSAGNLARKLLDRKYDELNDTYPSYHASQLSFDLSQMEHGPSLTATTILDLEIGASVPGSITAPSNSTYYPNPSKLIPLRTKGHTYPLPLLQTIVIAEPVTSPITCCPPVSVVARNLFDTILPKELQLNILRALVVLHIVEHERTVHQGSWTALKAADCKTRWVGRDKGVAELVKLSRVSKSWQRLVFDGQLWSDLDLQSFPRIPAELLSRLTTSSGHFVRSINFTGHTRLTAQLFSDITQSISSKFLSADEHCHITQLTDINLTGCNSLNGFVLHDIIRRSPSLCKLSLRGSTAVTNITCDIIANHCPQLTILDLSRCRNMDSDGIFSLMRHRGSSNSVLPLRELRICSLRRVNDNLMAALGMHMPYLEVLDLSGARELHNTALDAFVRCADNEATVEETILLTSREAGRDPGDPTKYRRRVTRLRHLSLSACPLLSDMACSHLAYALPKLEFLELAGIGSEMRDEGLVRLLKTTPRIRRLDLEEACEITDAVLDVITPISPDPTRWGSLQQQPGSALEHLKLSYATNLTNEALLGLVRACTNLRSLELDNTRVNSAVIREFVRVSRRRQMSESEIVAIDCRSVGESVVKELAGSTRSRKGWRGWDARKLGFLDARDEEALGVGTDECDAARVALKTFYSWQTVDAVAAAREKRRKQRRAGCESSRGTDDDYFSLGTTSSRWWPGGTRRGSGSNSPNIGGNPNDRDGCVVM